MLAFVFPLHHLTALGKQPPPEDATADRRWRERAAATILEPLAEYPAQGELADMLEHDPAIAAGGPRRAGKTEAIGRKLLALCLERDGFTVVIGTSTLSGPTKNWLDRKGRPSATALLREHGFLPPKTAKNSWQSQWCQVTRSQGHIVSIAFAWGSQISVIDVGQLHLIDKHRGQTAHVWWFDEAQSIAPLPTVLKDLANPTKLDHGGSVVLSGTPGEEIDSLFGQISTGKTSGYQRVHLSSWQNPRYGKTFAERWAYVIATLIRPDAGTYQISDDDVARLERLSEDEVEAIRHGSEDSETGKWVATLSPSFLREIMGRWVGDYGSLVYHWVPEIYWCDHEPDIEDAIELLPPVAGQWHAVIGHDVGWSKGSMAWVVLVWADRHPCAYQIFSHVEKRMPEHEEFAFTERLIDRLKDAGFAISGLVVDMVGMLAPTHASWDRTLKARIGLPVTLPQKSGLLQRIKAINLDLARGYLRVCAGGALDVEGRHLRWHPEKAGIIDVGRVVTIGNKPCVPGDHALDAARYGFALLNAYWQRPEKQLPGTALTQMLGRTFGSDELALR
jgi:hypothetical protein